jgi:hypothetical protein
MDDVRNELGSPDKENNFRIAPILWWFDHPHPD